VHEVITLNRIAEIRESGSHLAQPLINELLTAVEQLIATCRTDDLIIADKDKEIADLKSAAKYWEKRVRELGDDDV
jgi:hypothetical protein